MPGTQTHSKKKQLLRKDSSMSADVPKPETMSISDLLVLKPAELEHELDSEEFNEEEAHKELEGLVPNNLRDLQIKQDLLLYNQHMISKSMPRILVIATGGTFACV